MDHRPEDRRWFVEAGMPEIKFEGEPEKYGVGVNQIVAQSGKLSANRLFTFCTPQGGG